MSYFEYLIVHISQKSNSSFQFNYTTYAKFFRTSSLQVVSNDELKCSKSATRVKSLLSKLLKFFNISKRPHQVFCCSYSIYSMYKLQKRNPGR